MDANAWIERNGRYTITDGGTGFSLNVAGMKFADGEIAGLSEKSSQAHLGMRAIEAGEIKNPDEKRKVTHFTDRAIYPKTELFADVEKFASDLRRGLIKGSTGARIESAVINGIGGSALGPQLMQFAVNGPYWNELPRRARKKWLKIYFLDNTDSAGIADLLAAADLKGTVVVNISKSGGTQETKNNMIALRDIYLKAGLDYARHFCAITMEGSELDRFAKAEKFLKIFPMADSIGGRTSVTSVVGHLPAALAGIDFRSFLRGACKMDGMTRTPVVKNNPSYLLAAMWYLAGAGRGDRNMVIVPYSDRLVLLSKYLQQLVMESLGKEKDLDGKIVHQGLNVFGNKGGTDAHAFIQQLNDGRDDFFVTFIEVLKDRMDLPVEDGISMGDYLHGFLCGLSSALLSKGRQVIRLQIRDVDEYNMGMLIALYERAVAFYAELIHINAFHQPGVQAYKLASKGVISLLKDVEGFIASSEGFTGTAAEISAKLGRPGDELDVDGILAKFAENAPGRKIGGCHVTRKWSARKGWIYSVLK